MYGNDLQTLLDFCGSPQNDAVERVMGIYPKLHTPLKIKHLQKPCSHLYANL